MFKLEHLMKMHFFMIKNEFYDVDFLPKRMESIDVSSTPGKRIGGHRVGITCVSRGHHVGHTHICL